MLYAKKLTAGLAAVVTCLLSLGSLHAQPAFFDMECPGDGRNSQPIQARIEINGANAVPDEDYVALFDSDGFVVGTGTFVLSSGFCGQATITLINFGVFGVPPNDDAGCPPGFGANDGETLVGLVYDGSENTYYELPGDLTYEEGALNMQPGGGLCNVVNAVQVSLPATLTDFRGRLAGPKQVRLDWEVAREENVSHYEVQRSSNARDWTAVGEIAAAGDSETALSYGFDDRELPAGQLYYRLRVVDFDGAEEFSGIVIVEVAQNGPRGVNVFPNPASAQSMLSVQLTGEWRDDLPVTAELFDVTGRRIVSLPNVSTGTSAVVLPAGITSGLYALRTRQGDQVVVSKVSIR